MKNNDLEKNIKDQLESYENFDGDKMAMWGEIEQELDKKKKRGFFWLWFGTGVLIIGLTMAFLFFGKNKETQLAKNTSAVSSNFENPETLDTKDLSINKIEVSKNETTSDNKKTAPYLFTPKKKTTTKTTNLFSNNKDIAPTLVEQPTSEEKVMTTAIVNQEIEAMKTNTSNNEVINFLPPLYVELNLKKSDILELNLDTFFIQKNDDDELEEKLWSLNFSGGLLTNTSGYNSSSTFSSLQKESNSPELGWSFQMEIERLLPKDFYLSSGIHFNRHWIELDYNSLKTETQFLENVIIGFDLDLAIGDTTFIYVDTFLTSVTEREVKHHNRYDKLTIPILLGKRWTKGKFSYGLFAGVGIDIWLRQKGRSLNPDEFIFDYDSKNQDNLNRFPKLGISAHFKGVVNYSIGKNSSLFLQPNLNFSLKDWSPSNNGIKQRPITFGINLGYQFKF